MITSDISKIFVYNQDGNTIGGTWSGLNTQLATFTLANNKKFQDVLGASDYVFVAYENIIPGIDEPQQAKIRMYVAPQATKLYVNSGVVAMSRSETAVSIVENEDEDGNVVEEIVGSNIANIEEVRVTSNSVIINWEQDSVPEDEVDVYEIYRNGQPIARTNDSYYEDKGLKSKTTYTYSIIIVTVNGTKSFVDEYSQKRITTL